MSIAPGTEIHQHVTAVAGTAYGVIGADLHVFGDGTPLYLLAEHRPPDVSDRAWLRELPSRMLDAGAGVVPFTGRDRDQDELRAWREAQPRLAVRWLHAPGGQGKTRLADHIATQAADDGWRVVVAALHVGMPQPLSHSQDLRLDGHCGVLLIVDYADRYPLSTLIWLLRNSLLHQHDTPARVLMIARSPSMWPALRAPLEDPRIRAHTSEHHLTPLTVDDGSGRLAMFTAARDSFAAIYQIPDPTGIAAPISLDHPDFGLTLTVHVAALVAVDAHATGDQPPTNPEQLTRYLLDHEREHWTRLYEGRSRGLDHHTPQSVMARAVFTAALTGPLPHAEATALLRRVEQELPAERILTDHRRCYPPTDPNRVTVLEPLYPDRLAEDYLALCLPGHHLPGHTPDPWADTALTLLLTPAASGALPPYAARTITFLAAASDRWPHLIPTLEALEKQLPDHVRGALTIAAADLTERLANHRLARATDPAELAEIYVGLGQRLDSAHRYEKAEAAMREAVRLYRLLAEEAPATFEPSLAKALAFLAVPLLFKGLNGDWTTAALNLAIRDYRWTPSPHADEALTALGEAFEIYRRLAQVDPAGHAENFAAVSGLMAVALMRAERWQEALNRLDKALALFRRLAQDNPAEHEASLAAMLDLHVLVLRELDRPADGLPSTTEAIDIYRRLAERDPAEYETNLQSGLETFARVLNDLNRYGEALEAIHEAVRIARRLAQDNPAEHTEALRSALEQHVQVLMDQDRWDVALTTANEVVRLVRRLAQGDPHGHKQSLAGNLSTLAMILWHLERRAEATAVFDESIAIRRRLAQDDPAEHGHIIYTELAMLGTVLAEQRRWPEALTVTAEATKTIWAIEGQRYGVESHLAAAVIVLADQLAGKEWRSQRPAEKLAAGFKGHLAALVEDLLPTSAGPGRGDEAFPGFAEVIEEFRRRFAHRNPAGELYRQLTGVDPLAPEPRLLELGPPPRPMPKPRRKILVTLRNVITAHHHGAKRNRDQHLPGLAATLGAQALALRSFGRQDEALAPACEATQIYLGLAHSDPYTYEPVLADAWVRAAVVIGELGYPDTSTAAIERAIEIRRRLAGRDRARHEPALAAELAIMARTLAKRGRWEEAVASATESFEIRRRLGKAGSTSADSLTAAADFLTTHLTEAELGAEQLAALRAAVAARRSISIIQNHQ